MELQSESGDSASPRAHDQLEVWEDEAAAPLVFPLSAERTLIGSGPQAHVVLSHPSIAPVHAQLVRTSFGRFRVQDVPGSPGVYVAGAKVRDRLLEFGEDARIGVFTLRVRRRGSGESRFLLPASERGAALAGRGAVPALAISKEHLSSLLRLGRTLEVTAAARDRMQVLCECLVSPPLLARSAAVLRTRGVADVEVLRGATASGVPDELAVPASLLERLLATREPVVERDARLAVIACPLHSDDDRVDAVIASVPPTHATDEWLSLIALAAETHERTEHIWEMRTHTRERVRLERELEIAHEIQAGLIPRTPQFEGPLRGVDIALGFEPCRWVGGDYVDAVALPDGRVLMAVADVCGRGMQAALVASGVRCAVHVIAAYTTSIAELLERLNLHLCSQLPPHSFVTMVCAALDVGSGHLEYASAGHPSPIVVQPGGPVDVLNHGDNPPLGMMDTRIVARTTTLGVGETLILYSDGVTELLNETHEPLGMVQLAEILSDLVARKPRATARETQLELMNGLRAFRGRVPPSDDATLLVARRRGNSIQAPYG